MTKPFRVNQKKRDFWFWIWMERKKRCCVVSSESKNLLTSKGNKKVFQLPSFSRLPKLPKRTAYLDFLVYQDLLFWCLKIFLVALLVVTIVLLINKAQLKRTAGKHFGPEMLSTVDVARTMKPTKRLIWVFMWVVSGRCGIGQCKVLVRGKYCDQYVLRLNPAVIQNDVFGEPDVLNLFNVRTLGKSIETTLAALPRI